MSMEKNGAISSNTPQPGCGKNCGCTTKQAAELRQLELFPDDVRTADALDRDLVKDAVDTVKNASSKTAQ